mmetsp:Transcript_10481/g.18528  ORF Transcript_10481/g.18528 Transcript_10481/m.18528 type:complete len:316 (+) Transcript_10481:464-1411(+)
MTPISVAGMSSRMNSDCFRAECCTKYSATYSRRGLFRASRRHRRHVLSLEMVRIIDESALKEASTTPRCPASTCRHSPVSTRQIRHVMSALPVTSSTSSLLKATRQTPAECPIMMAVQPPVMVSQMRAAPSSLPLAMSHPLLLNSVSTTSRKWPRRVFDRPPLTSQTLQVPSPLELTARFPIGLKRTQLMSPPCEVKTCRHSPRSTSHSRMVSSVDPLSSLVPSWLKSRHTISAVCPSRMASSLPFDTAHSLTTSSIPPDAMTWDCRSTATQTTSRSWPSSVCSRDPVVASQTRQVLSKEAVMIRSHTGSLYTTS